MSREPGSKYNCLRDDSTFQNTVKIMEQIHHCSRSAGTGSSCSSVPICSQWKCAFRSICMAGIFEGSRAQWKNMVNVGISEGWLQADTAVPDLQRSAFQCVCARAAHPPPVHRSTCWLCWRGPNHQPRLFVAGNQPSGRQDLKRSLLFWPKYPGVKRRFLELLLHRII